MHLRGASVLLSLFSALASTAPLDALGKWSGGCSFAQKVAGIQAEINTISSHTFADADRIPLAPLAARTFLITPNQLNGFTLPPINVGVTAETVRLELVALATVLDASVPAPSVQYLHNRNGSVTVDFIQLDRIALPHVYVREIHEFNDECQITSILGYVHGSLVCLNLGAALSNPTVKTMCSKLSL